MQCNRRYYYEYVERLELDAPVGAALRMGRAFANTLEHRDLEHVAASYSEYDLSPAMEVEIVQVEELARAYFQRYTEWEPGTEREVEFNSPLLGRGFLDGVITTGNGRIAVEDKLISKYHWTEASERALRIEMQTIAYFAAMREAGTPLTKLMRRATFKPTITQRTKRQPETLSEYRKRLADDIAGEPNKYFKCYDLYRSDAELDAFIDQVAVINAQIGTSEHASEVIEQAAYPQNTHACSSFGGCAFLDLCRDGELALPKYRIKERSNRPPTGEVAE